MIIKEWKNNGKFNNTFNKTMGKLIISKFLDEKEI